MKNIKVIKAMRLSLLVAMLSIGLNLTSCSPEPCEDCYTYVAMNGETSTVCIEYDCSNPNY